ncbi:MAG: hypothetical protein ABW224_02425 [Kibdelosporangium sp.]
MQTKGFLRRLALVLAGLLTLTVVTSGQAQAGPHHGKLCWPVWTNGQLKIICVDIQVQWPWDKYLECHMCGVGIDWSHDPVVRDDLEGIIGAEIVTGLSLLGDASFTRDPAQAAKLRDEALGAFTTAARLNDKSTMRVGAAGIADPVKNTFEQAGFTWLNAAGDDVADGVSLLQRSFSDPAAAPRLRAAAIAQFDEAYKELSHQEVIGG